MRRIVVLVVLGALASVASAQLSAAERQGLTDTLYVGNLTVRDLEFDRKIVTDLPLIKQAVEKPLDAADALMALHSLSGTRSVAQLLGHLRTKIYGDKESFEASQIPDVVVPDEVPEPARPSVKRLVTALLQTDECIRKATDKLSPEERRTLIEALPRYAADQPSIKFEFVKQPMPDLTTLRKLLGKCDLDWIRFGAQYLAQEVQEEMPKLKEIASQIQLDKVLKTTINGIVVEIGGQGNDIHDSTDATLCLDFGGNDRYTGRYGAGVGYASVLIDLGGDDTYDVPDLSIGAGVLGIGLSYDLGGNDVFRGKSICFGSGLAGVGALLKDDGDDLYQSVSLAQGFGCYGIGLLLDTKGDDRYTLGYLGQGAARTEGVGWLIDKAGVDVYRSGGLIPSSLILGAYVSMAQGFGSAGIGLLTDLGGDDAYLGGTTCQAAAREQGLGSLYDASGTDTYNAVHEAQACASRSSAAYLFDLAGSDTYTVREGNCHAFGHDYGVALLLDRAGDDIYAARDSRPGTGNANGLGIFIDADGDDRYFGPPGVGNPARGTGSLGIFCDLGGTDVYAEGLADGTATAGPKWSAAYDAVSHAPNPPLDPPKAVSKQLLPDADMDALLNKAADGTPDDAGKALDQLIAIGEPSVKWFIDKRLATATPGQERAMGWVVQQIGSKAVVAEIGSKDDARAFHAIAICQEGAVLDAAPALAAALKRPALTAVAVRAAGALRAKECVADLLALASSDDRSLRQAAIVSLSQIGDARAYEKMEPLLSSDDLISRKAAIDLVAHFPERALATAKALVGSGAERTARTGLEILAAVGSPEAMALAGRALEDPRRGMKIQAMLAVNGRCPKEFRPALVELRKSSDPLIAAVAARIDPGR